MEEPHSQDVLSDVHIYNKYSPLDAEKCAITRFKFTLPRRMIGRCGDSDPCALGTRPDTCNISHDGQSSEGPAKKRAKSDNVYTSKQLTMDTDGDIVVQRQPDDNGDVDPDAGASVPYVINIKHSLSTGLAQVGEQVWQGALLLCDYIIHEHRQLYGRTVVDLGAGTGLTSVVAAMFADKVYCTDVGENVLGIARDNVAAAMEFSTVPGQCQVLTRELDWFHDMSACDEKTEFGVDARDVADIQAAEILIAADVIYDDSITDAFFKTVGALMNQPPTKTLVIGLERRLVFTIEDLDISSPGYNHFRKHIDNLSTSGEERNTNRFHVQQINTQKIPQYFDYKRTTYLELWKINTQTSGT